MYKPLSVAFANRFCLQVAGGGGQLIIAVIRAHLEEHNLVQACADALAAAVAAGGGGATELQVLIPILRRIM